jgi:hypothetical protein
MGDHYAAKATGRIQKPYKRQQDNKKADPGIGKVRQRVRPQASNHIRYTGLGVAGDGHRPEEG